LVIEVSQPKNGRAATIRDLYGVLPQGGLPLFQQPVKKLRRRVAKLQRYISVRNKAQGLTV
jgi:hypothetical protein